MMLLALLPPMPLLASELVFVMATLTWLCGGRPRH